MTGITTRLATALGRRDRHIAALSGERPKNAILDVIAECEGEAVACRTLLAFPIDVRLDHATRLLCESMTQQPVNGNARLMRDAECGVYAEVVSGRVTLT